MIQKMQNYKKVKIVGQFGDSGFVYQVTRQENKYYLYEFQQFGQAEIYNFKLLRKLISSHILAVCQQFQENGTKYIVTDYAEKDLLALQTSQPNRVFALPVALDYFSKIILAIQEMHQNKLIYRNIRPEMLKLRGDDIFLYDFTLSQFCKRKQRMFDIVGCQSFLAPQLFSQDGYGFQIDIWAAGVLLFFMLTNQYPFKFPSKSQKACQQVLKTVAQGFSFEKKLQTCKNPGYLKSNKILEDFFYKIFTYDYTQRITIKHIKNHKLMSGFFPEKVDKQMLQAIGQQQSSINSLLMTRFLDLKKFKISQQIQKQQLILDFIERCSESILLDCPGYISQSVRYKAQFSILKLAVIRINNLIDICYGKRKPQFQYNQQQFQIARSSSAFKKVIESLQKKQKILLMLYKGSYVSLQNTNNTDKKDVFYAEEISQDFNSIKISYRVALSQMFEAVKTVMAKHKADKAILRKTTQLMARMVIMHLINRIFQDQDFNRNFALYIAWNKNNSSIENLDSWIHTQKQQSLKQFIKETTKNYL